MSNEALRNKFEQILTEFYSADDAEYLSWRHAEWHERLIEKIKSSETLPDHVEARGVSLGRRLALLRRKERVEVTREQLEAIQSETLAFLSSIAPELASPRQIFAACSITGCSRAKIERALRIMREKGVISSDKPDSFYTKSYRITGVASHEGAAEEQEAVLPS